MKTLNQKNMMSGMTNIFLTISTSILLLTGCQKDELAQMSTSTTQTNNENGTVQATNSAIDKIKGNAQPIDQRTFTMIFIDHSAAQTQQPDYSIELLSDGIAVFDGRKNTAYEGTYKFKVTKNIVQTLNELFYKYNLASMNKLEQNLDMPVTTTSFRASIDGEIISRTDYNTQESFNLIQLRDKTEQLLNISSLVNHKRNIDDQKANQNQVNN